MRCFTSSCSRGGISTLLLLLAAPLTALSATLGVAPSQLTFIQPAGTFLPPAQTISITASTTLPVQVTNTGAHWLTVGISSLTTPAIVTVWANPSGLFAGHYESAIEIASAGATNSPLSIPVTLDVTVAPQATLSTSQLAFFYEPGDPIPEMQTLVVYGPPGAFSAAASAAAGSWLSISYGPPEPPSVIRVWVNPIGLPPGTYQGMITIAHSAGPMISTVGVTLRVNASSGLWLSSGPLTFRYRIGDPLPARQNLTVSHFTWSIFSITPQSSGWLFADPESALAPTTISVWVDPTGLAAGTYRGSLLFQIPGGWTVMTVPITLEVTGAPPLSISSSVLQFQAAAGGPAPSTQSISVNSGVGANFSAHVAAGTWLSVNPTFATTPAMLTISVNHWGLAPGNYLGSVVISAADASSGGQLLTVRLAVTGTLQITTNPASLRFEAPGAPQSLTINSSWPTPVAIAATAGWLQVTPTSGTTPLTVLVSVNPTGLASGWHSGAISVSAPGSIVAPAIVPVALGVSGGNPVISQMSNGAGLSNEFAPGSLITIYGHDLGPTDPQVTRLAAGQPMQCSAAGTRLLANGIESPLLYVHDNQINGMLPYALAGQRRVELRVDCHGMLSDPVMIDLNDTAPVLFTVNGTGRGQGAFANQSGTPNSADSPAARGSVLILYGAGGGLTDIPSNEQTMVHPDIHPLRSPVTAWIGGVQADVEFAGQAPNMAPGMMQVNVRIPIEVTPGGAVPVILRIGNAFSQLGVTAAIS